MTEETKQVDRIHKIAPIMMGKGKDIPLPDVSYNIKEPANSFERLVPSLIEKGIENINLSMFSEEMRRDLLNAAGDEYLKRGASVNAIKMFSITGNKEKLIKIADQYRDEGYFTNAIEVYALISDKKSLLKQAKSA